MQTVWVTGHNNMVETAIVRCLEKCGQKVLGLGSVDFDLRDQMSVAGWLKRKRPDVVIFASALVSAAFDIDHLPAHLIYDSVTIENNVFHGAHLAGIDRIVYIGSPIYSKLAPQISGVNLCHIYRQQHGRNYVSVLPCRLYGPGDNFDLAAGHLIPGLLSNFHRAKVLASPRVSISNIRQSPQELLFVDDFARAILSCLEHYNEGGHIYCGSGSVVSVAQLAFLLREIVKYDGSIELGANSLARKPYNLMDSRRIREFGWRPETSIGDGLKATYRWYIANYLLRNEQETELGSALSLLH